MNKTKSILNIFALFFLLVILPGGSIFYLSKGFQHQKETYAELKNYGTVPPFKLLSQPHQDFIENKDLKGKITAIEFTTLAALKNSPQLQQNISNLNSQFGDRHDFLLITHLTDQDSLSAEDLLFLKEKIELKNPNQWFVFAQQKLETLVKEYHLPQSNQPVFALIDTSLVIRHYYNATDREDVGNLAKHIAMILPREKDKDAILIREKEK